MVIAYSLLRILWLENELAVKTDALEAQGQQHDLEDNYDDQHLADGHAGWHQYEVDQLMKDPTFRKSLRSTAEY